MLSVFMLHVVMLNVVAPKNVVLFINTQHSVTLTFVSFYTGQCPTLHKTTALAWPNVVKVFCP
jgi:hypothetical protein